jgi:hypothetical protein
MPRASDINCSAAAAPSSVGAREGGSTVGKEKEKRRSTRPRVGERKKNKGKQGQPETMSALKYL